MDSCIHDIYTPCCYNCPGCIRAENDLSNDFNDFIFDYEHEEEVIEKYEA